MSRPSNRQKILTSGLRVVHERGFGGASVRDIVSAAGVPQGSFTNHFASKEAFGLEVIDLYAAHGRALIETTLADAARPPLQRLAAWIDASRDRCVQDGMRNGCLLGNFTAETGDGSEAIRLRLVEVFADQQREVAACLRDAVRTGDVAAGLDCELVAGFVVASLQGASLLAKAERSPAPLERVRQVLFATVLR